MVVKFCDTIILIVGAQDDFNRFQVGKVKEASL